MNMLPYLLVLFGQEVPAPPQPNNSAEGGVVVLILSNAATIGLTIYLAISRRRAAQAKERLENLREEKVMTKEEREDAVREAWAHAKQQQVQYKQAMLEMGEQLKTYRQELVDLRKNEREMYAKVMAQSETIKYQKEEIDELKEEMTRRGWREGSHEHRPLKPDAEVGDGKD